MATPAWLLLVVTGIVVGFLIGRSMRGSSAVIQELERERDAAREALRAHREEVDEHFARTAQLFDQVTSDYRSLYEHLALGARRLSALHGEAAPAPLEQPEQRQLAPAAEESEAAEAGEAAPRDETGEQPREEDGADPTNR